MLGAQDLLREDAPEVSEEDFPDWLDSGGHQLELTYRFEPGADDDGVTVRVPLEWLNTLDEGRLQWLAPGLLEEKVEELLRGLPKPTRRALTPAPGFARLALERIGMERDRPLFETLADALGAESGLDLDAAQFAAASIPEHLRFRYAVLGDKGQELAVSRDLPALKERFGIRARRHFMDRQGGQWNRDGETRWTFGRLPASCQTPDGATAWPALVDQQDSVGLRLFDTQAEAAYSQLEGVRRLVALSLHDKLAYLHKNHGIGQPALVAWSAWGGVAELVRDLAWASLCAVVDEYALSVRDEAAFDALVRSARGALGQAFRQGANLLTDLLPQTAGLSLAIDRLPEAREAARNDMRGQLDDLVYEGFLRDLEPGRLQHYPRYLAAMQARLDRIAVDPARDARLASEVEPYWSLYLGHIAAGGEYGPALDDFRWLLEEFRVSQYAQSLGTASKVSAKRLEIAWRKVSESD
jgi:ATP-dependent helicase HrpA